VTLRWIEIRNNVFEDVSRASYGGSGRMLLIDGGDNIRLLNNTSFNAGTAIYATGHAATGLLLENNVFDYGDYGVMGDDASPGNGTLAAWFPGAVTACLRTRNRGRSLPATGIPPPGVR